MILALILATICHAQTYSRTETTYTIQSGGTPVHVAERIMDSMNSTEIYLIPREIAVLNNVKVDHQFSAGETIRVPNYKPSTVYSGYDCPSCGNNRSSWNDIRNWHCAVIYGEEFGVSPALLAGIRRLENPCPCRDHYALGVVRYRNTDIRTQYRMAARALSRYRVTWNPRNPTRDSLLEVGKIYCPPNASHWRNSVWRFYQAALGR